MRFTKNMMPFCFLRVCVCGSYIMIASIDEINSKHWIVCWVTVLRAHTHTHAYIALRTQRKVLANSILSHNMHATRTRDKR